MNVKFRQWECKLQFGKYSNGRTAIQLMQVGTGEPIAVATVIIKDYSENEGIEDALRTAGVIDEPLRQVRTGMVVCHVCKLLINE